MPPDEIIQVDEQSIAGATKVFVSYSRKDKQRVDGIVQALQADERYQVFIDIEDVLPSEEWRKRLGNLISEADTVIFCLSPDSASSDICAWEAAYASDLNKRIVPIVIRDVDGAGPAQLSKLNYIFFRESDAFERSFSNLVTALNTDINWIREHTRLGVLATHWQRKSKPSELLLRGAEIDATEKWASYRPATAPALTGTMLEFMAASRAQAEVEERQEKDRLARLEIEKKQLEVVREAERRGKQLFVYAAAIFGVLLVAIGLRIADPEPVARLREITFDSYLQLSPRIPDPSYPVRIVAIDEASLDRLGQWPWPRTHLARIIDRLREAGARTITLDLIMAEPDRLSPEAFAKQFAEVPELAPLMSKVASLPSNDARLAEAIGKAPVILGLAGAHGTAKPPQPRAYFAISGDDPRNSVPEFLGAVSNLPVLNARARGLGAVNWVPERDQIFRRVPLLVSVAGTLYPSLPLEALRVALGEKTIWVRSSGSSRLPAHGKHTGVEDVRVGQFVLPTDGNGEMWLRFARSDPRRYISAHRIFDGSFDAGAISGRDILIGTTAIGLLDLRSTPLDAAVPGVEIYAQALEQMLSGEHLVRPSFASGLEIFLIVIIGLPVALLIRYLRPFLAASLGIFALFGVFCGSWLAYLYKGYLFDPVYPTISLVLIYAIGLISAYQLASAERKGFRRTLKKV